MPRKLIANLMRGLAVLSLPVLLFAANLRIVTNHWFVRWEYGKAAFPPDPYGLGPAERINLAEVCVDYLATDADISLLADLRLPNGDPAFNERELSHMDDVQAVFGTMITGGGIAAVVLAVVVASMLASDRTHGQVPAALMGGSLLTLGLLVAVGTYILLNWNHFFTTFHRIFFEGSSWIFAYSDTLIRLFPVRFWMDVAAMLIGLLIAEAVIIGAIGWRWASSWQAAHLDG